jgi:hypothetical protein
LSENERPETPPSSLRVGSKDASTGGDDTEIIFIAGANRSGSTVLDRLLAAPGEAVSAGELRLIWTACTEADSVCGCGSLFKDCEFWNEVLTETFGAPDRVPLDRLLHLQSDIDRYRNIPKFLSPVTPASFKASLSEYGSALQSFIRAIRKVSGRRVIVDSSKSAPQGFILAKESGARVKVIHLVRDGRATSFSWTRRRSAEVAGRNLELPRYPVFQSSRLWLVQNFSAEMLRAKVDDYKRVLYEELAASPRDVLSELERDLGIPVPELTEEGTANLDVNHTVAGNPMRFDSGPVRIRLDEEWRTAMPTNKRHLVTLLTLPLLFRYGYMRPNRS